MTPSKDPLAKAKASQADLEAALTAAADRRDAAAVELKAATQDLNDLALATHADRALPVQRILAAARMKESWFYQLRKAALAKDGDQ